MPAQLPPMPYGGICCKTALYFQRAGVIGQPGHFVCRRCGRRFRMYDEAPWVPGPTSQPTTTR